ncbi:MAG: hypothetical protein N2037_01100 [Acidimicrobiales bacterium]|nr:hypothetical protein [Acidimicrobiales bacterium]
MAQSRKKRKRAQAQKRAQHRRQVEKRRESEKHEHLPKVGTPADDAYRLKRSREDLVDFGLTHAKRGPINWVIVVGIVLLLIAAAVGLIIFAA